MKVYFDEDILTAQHDFDDSQVRFRWGYDGKALTEFNAHWLVNGVLADIDPNGDIISLRTGDTRVRYWTASTVGANPRWNDVWDHIQRQYNFMQTYTSIEQSAIAAAVEFLEAFANALR